MWLPFERVTIATTIWIPLSPVTLFTILRFCSSSNLFLNTDVSFIVPPLLRNKKILLLQQIKCETSFVIEIKELLSRRLDVILKICYHCGLKDLCLIPGRRSSIYLESSPNHSEPHAL